MKGGPFAQRRGPEYAGCCSHILWPRSLPCRQCVTNFLKYLALSNESPSVAVRCPLAPFMQNSSCEGPRQAAAFELCCARGCCLPGMACADTVIDSVCKRMKSEEGGLVWGSWSNSYLFLWKDYA